MKKHLVMCLCVILCSVMLMACKGSSTDDSYKTNAGSEEYSTTAMQTEALKEESNICMPMPEHREPVPW